MIDPHYFLSNCGKRDKFITLGECSKLNFQLNNSNKLEAVASHVKAGGGGALIHSVVC